ncbi:mitochondrial import inner membrane translocase subunit tim54 [Blyttiomyces sp. JEL0837]|nr:mitochondrial import inner membrane translocase subunit tim54 [Blyttiomyces sp. JEL0837]
MELKKVRKDLADRASTIANQPLHFHQRARKVRVYLAPDQWSEDWFRNYAKPVFDAGALDYELINPERHGEVRSSVRDYIWTGKEELSKHLYEKQHPTPRTWFQYLFPAPFNPIEKILKDLDTKYRPEDGIIAVGPDSWNEMLQGLNDGCLSERSHPVPEPPPFEEPTHPGEHKTIQEAAAKLKEEYEKVKAKWETDRLYPVVKRGDLNLPKELELPVVGYLPARNNSGWSGFWRRNGGWFNQRSIMREVGEEALKIVLDQRSELKVGGERLVTDCDGKSTTWIVEGGDLEMGKTDVADWIVVEKGTAWEGVVGEWKGLRKIVKDKLVRYAMTKDV